MARTPAARVLPRISVNDLALYMLSSDTARIGIVRRAKHQPTAPIIRYRDVRSPLCAYLSDIRRDAHPLRSAEEMFEQRMADASQSPLMQDDARNSIEVLHAIERMRNQLGQFTFIQAPARQAKVQLGGVTVSVKADLVVHADSRQGVPQAGAAIFRMTQDDADNESARSRRREIGLYVATLARIHVDQNLQSDRQSHNRLCMAIDVQHGEFFPAPDANTRRMNDLENACRFIAALWATI